MRMAKENRSWGYDRIVGALANPGREVYEETGRHGTRRKLPVVPRGRLGW
jgi:putative transposase